MAEPFKRLINPATVTAISTGVARSAGSQPEAPPRPTVSRSSRQRVQRTQRQGA